MSTATPHPRPGLDLETLARRNRELEMLYDSIRDLTSTLSVQEVIERMLDRILHHLGADMGSVMLLDRDHMLRIVFGHGLSAQIIEETRVALGQGISGRVAETGRPILVGDIESDPRFARPNRNDTVTSSFISAPLFVQGIVSGVINVGDKQSREPFDQDDLRVLEMIAGHAAVALANAERFEEMLDRARRDPLTGLGNSRHFDAALEREAKRSRRFRRGLGLALFDIDSFKRFNERHGSLEGDRVLAQIGRILGRACRTYDFPCRVKGDEFAVILPEASLRGAARFAERAHAALHGLELDEEACADLTFSIGVAALPDAGLGSEDLVQVARAELYRAKSSGGDTISPGVGGC